MYLLGLAVRIVLSNGAYARLGAEYEYRPEAIEMGFFFLFYFLPFKILS